MVVQNSIVKDEDGDQPIRGQGHVTDQSEALNGHREGEVSDQGGVETETEPEETDLIRSGDLNCR